jgi:hypothetical protein
VVQWKEADRRAFLQYSSDIGPLWSRTFEGYDTRVRSAKILTVPHWKELIGNAYLPDYKTGSYFTPGSEPWKVADKARVSPLDKDYPVWRILSVYDSDVGARLFVDGGHRARVIETRLTNGLTKFDVEVIECHGTKMDVIFHGDYPRVMEWHTTHSNQ